MLDCPACGEDTTVTDSRDRDDGRFVRRRRLCTGCGLRFGTEEHLAPWTLDPTINMKQGNRRTSKTRLAHLLMQIHEA